MKKYYTIESNPMMNNNSRIRLGNIPERIDKRAFLLDEWQYINDEEEYIEFMKLGEELTDFYTYNIPLISARVKELLDDFQVSNTFYKPIYLYENGDVSNVEEYYLMLVEPIECVVWDKSNYTQSEFTGLKKITGQFTLDYSTLGNFKIFKVKDVQNRFWIIDEDIKQKLDEIEVKGAKILEPSDYFGL